MFYRCSTELDHATALPKCDKLPERDAIIYKRSDVAKPVWYGRFKIPGERRYVVRSSKSTDFAKAKTWAAKEFDRLCFKQEGGPAAIYEVPLRRL